MKADAYIIEPALLKVTNLIDRGVQFYRLWAGPFLKYSSLYLALSTFFTLPFYLAMYAAPETAGARDILVLLGILVFVHTILAPGVTRFAASAYFNESLGLFSSYKISPKSWIRYFFVTVLRMLIYPFTAPCIFIPGLLLRTRFLFTREILFHEKVGLRSYFKRSSQLSRKIHFGNLGNDIMIVLFLYLMAVAVLLFLGLMTSLFKTMPSPSYFSNQMQIATYLLDPKSLFILLSTYSLMMPLYSLLRYLHYVNTKIRLEGWDIRVFFQVLKERRS